MNPSTFEPHVGSTFSVSDAAGASAEITLAAVTRFPPTPGVDQFNIIFHGPGGQGVSQGTYRFAHSALGEFDLFITPIIGSGPQRMVYEACFSRLVTR